MGDQQQPPWIEITPIDYEHVQTFFLAATSSYANSFLCELNMECLLSCLNFRLGEKYSSPTTKISL